MTEEEYQQIEDILAEGFYTGAEKMLYIMRLSLSSGKSLKEAIALGEGVINKLNNKGTTDEEAINGATDLDDPNRVH
jgi:hypothetical protein